jgi:hypothetical protein
MAVKRLTSDAQLREEHLVPATFFTLGLVVVVEQPAKRQTPNLATGNVPPLPTLRTRLINPMRLFFWQKKNTPHPLIPEVFPAVPIRHGRHFR